MNTNKNNTLLRTIAVFTGIVLFILAGVGVTSAAANGSIPGDALYPVKTTLKQARFSLAQDAGDRAQMRIAYAAQHLEEINALVKEGRYQEIRQTVVEFETDINSALLELETVSKTDPARATAIAGNVSMALTRYAQVLSNLSATAPEAVKSEVNRALDTTQIAGGLNQSGSDDHGASGSDDFGPDDSVRHDSVNKNSQDDNSGAASSSDSYEYVGKINMKTSDSSNDASMNDSQSRDDSVNGKSSDSSSKDTSVDDKNHGTDDHKSGNTSGSTDSSPNTSSQDSTSHDSGSSDTSSHDGGNSDTGSHDSGSNDSGSHD